jgi:MFS transporter, FHS family, L-fucose permease
MNKKTNWIQFGSLVSVFFFWGFVAASNDILIPVFKKAFSLSQGQSQLVSVAYYIAYTVGAILYFFASKVIGSDVLNKIGYKNGLSLGLLISALGTLLFYPAANTGSFELMISGLFIVGLGFSLQQIVANPLAIALGSTSTGSQRLTLAGGVNNFGTTIGPLIVSYAIFGSATSSNTTANIESVKIPYLILGVAFLIVAILLKFSSLPNQIHQEDSIEKNTVDQFSQLQEKTSALQYPQLVLGMVAIFVYVGVEVATASNLPAYLEKSLNIETKFVAPYISLYWASLMIGRWTGAVGVFSVNKSVKITLSLLMPFLAFGVFILVNSIAHHNVSQFYIYSIFILLMIGCNFLSQNNPIKMLLIFSLAGIIALIIGMVTTGVVSAYAFTSVGLFCSTLWPCIFTIAVAGLGKHTNQGSSYLIMMIMGGGLVSWLQGFFADKMGIQYSFIIGVICFAYLVFYAITIQKHLTLQGINLSDNNNPSH